MPALRPEIHLGGADSAQAPLELASDGVLRYVWESKFGHMLIEARDGVAYVNGRRVMSAVELQVGRLEHASGEEPREMDDRHAGEPLRIAALSR